MFSGHGDAEFSPATCSRCGLTAYLVDPQSVSVTAERLLYRSEADLKHGDYSLSIVVGVMAIESFLTRLFLKMKGMESYAVTFKTPTAAQEAEWEKEFPKSGGFPRPADFVAQSLVGTTFDEFVARNKKASEIFSNLTNSAGTTPTQYFQDQLYKRRNRIAHWGYVNSGKSEAQLCLTVAVAAVSILREMDAATDWVGLAQKLAQAGRAGVAAERERLHEIIARNQRSDPAEQHDHSSH